MVLLNLYIDSIVQKGDLVRFDFSRSVIPEDIIFLEIRPDTSGDFISIDVKETHLDYFYESVGNKEVTLRITDSQGAHQTSKTIKVLSEDEERLFSNDEMLLGYEPNIFSLLPDGKNSFIYAHRIAQNEILKELSIEDRKVRAENIFDIEEVQNWSKFKTLALIFESNVIVEDDTHIRKKKIYLDKELGSKNSSLVRIDSDLDGNVDSKVQNLPTSIRLV